MPSNLLYVRDNTVMIPTRMDRGAVGWFQLAERSYLTEFGLMYHAGPQAGNILEWLRTGNILATAADDGLQCAFIRPDGTITEYRCAVDSELFTNIYHMGKGFVIVRSSFPEDGERAMAAHLCMPSVKRVKEALEAQTTMMCDSHRIFTLAQLQRYYAKNELKPLRSATVSIKKQ